MLSAPTAPTSYNVCNALAQEFSTEIQTLNRQHDECLQGASKEESGQGGSCSKASCQALHTARDKATVAASQEAKVCSERVAKYMADQQQAQATRQRRAEIEAERDRRQQSMQQSRDQRDKARGAAEKALRDSDSLRASGRDHRDSVAADPVSEPSETAQLVPEPRPGIMARQSEPPLPAARATVKPLTTEQTNAIAEGGIKMLSKYLADLSLTSIRSAVLRGAGRAVDNPVIEIAKPFLEVENYNRIREAVEAQRRQGESGSWNENESRLLDQLENDTNPTRKGRK